jgi:flagellar motor switch protein FliM
MKCLEFERSGVIVAGRYVRRARFWERSSLPIAAACVVANGMRETLASLLLVPVEVRLFEPVIPNASAWNDILRDAMFFHVQGSLTEAAIVLRPQDARTLACAAFGEQISTERSLSPIEGEVIQRLLRLLAGTLTSVCGSPNTAPTVSPMLHQTPYMTYFELSLEQPVVAHIGVALARDPSPEPHGAVAIEDLRGVYIEARARLVGADISAQKILDLQPGHIIPLKSHVRTTLTIGERRFACGACGASDGHYALVIDEPIAA